MKILIGLLLGYLLHILVIDTANFLDEKTFTECVVKMHQGIYPSLHPTIGGHYCLADNKTTTLEKIAYFTFGFEKIYNEKIGQKLLEDAYNASKKSKNEK